jgi:hypothetical protein
MHHCDSRRLKAWFTLLQGLGLVAIASPIFSIISAVLFGILGLAPSSPEWPLASLSGGILALAGAAVGTQTLKPTRLMDMTSGLASGAILGFYYVGQLSEDVLWSIGGGMIGSLVGGALAGWAYQPQQGLRQHSVGLAIAFVSTFCAYGTAFGLGAWAFMAVNTQHWGLAMVFTLPTALYLWLTQRSLTWIYQQWRQGWKLD